jgi:aspartyl protease family protein
VNEGDQAIHFIYLLLCLLLVGSAFMVRRIPIAQGLKMFMGWVLIFGAAFIGFTLKDEFVALGQRAMLEARGGVVQQSEGGEIRIRQSPDGHFWADGEVNGAPVRFLIDSGATTTSLTRETADRVGIEMRGGFGAMIQTANGVVVVDRGRAERLKIGPIEREGLGVHVSTTFGNTNVLGMNFLSTLSGWGVEGRTLVLKS